MTQSSVVHQLGALCLFLLRRRLLCVALWVSLLTIWWIFSSSASRGFGAINPSSSTDPSASGVSANETLIIYWTPFFDKSLYPVPVVRRCHTRERGPQHHAVDFNSDLTCRFTSSRESVERAQAVVFHARDLQLAHMPKVKPDSTVWVYYSMENPIFDWRVYAINLILVLSPRSVIRVDQFDGPKALADHLRRLERDDDLYRSHFDYKLHHHHHHHSVSVSGISDSGGREGNLSGAAAYLAYDTGRESDECQLCRKVAEELEKPRSARRKVQVDSSCTRRKWDRVYGADGSMSAEPIVWWIEREWGFGAENYALCGVITAALAVSAVALWLLRARRRQSQWSIR